MSETASTIEKNVVNGELWNDLEKAISPALVPFCWSLPVPRLSENKVHHAVGPAVGLCALAQDYPRRCV